MPLTETYELDNRYSNDHPINYTILGTSFIYAIHAVNALNPAQERYYEIKQPATFVEVAPFGEYSGTVISLGSIGFSLMLDLGDKTSERIFLNSVSYVSNAPKPQIVNHYPTEN